MAEHGWLIERPDSSPNDPEYIGVTWLRNGSEARFFWTQQAHALRFAREQDAMGAEKVIRRLQPELWRREVPGRRIAEHIWESDHG